MRKIFLLKVGSFLVLLLLSFSVNINALKIDQKDISYKIFANSNKTWRVPDDFSSIKKAVGNEEVKDGDTIFVRSGIYKESYIRITKRINLIGEDKQKTIIDAEKKEIWIIAINADYVKIAGFTFKNCSSKTYEAIAIAGANECIIENNIFSDNWIGVRLMGAHFNTIINNDFSDNHCYSIFIDGDGYDNICTYNTIENNILINGISSISSGISISFSHDNIVNNNIIKNYSSTGLILAFSDNNQVNNNYISDNEIGVYIRGSYLNKISNNNIKENKIGIQVTLCRYNKNELLNNNDFENNDYDVIFGRERNRIFPIFLRLFSINSFFKLNI